MKISEKQFEAGRDRIAGAAKVVNEGASAVIVTSEAILSIGVAFQYLAAQRDELRRALAAAEKQAAEDKVWRDAQQDTIRLLQDDLEAAQGGGQTVNVYGGSVTINLGEPVGFDLGEAIGRDAGGKGGDDEGAGDVAPVSPKAPSGPTPVLH